MAKSEDAQVLDKPTVHITRTGARYVDVNEMANSVAGQRFFAEAAKLKIKTHPAKIIVRDKQNQSEEQI